MDDSITLQSGSGAKRKLALKLSEFSGFSDFETRVAEEFRREPGVSRSAIEISRDQPQGVSHETSPCSSLLVSL